jgi:hypothetical protein
MKYICRHPHRRIVNSSHWPTYKTSQNRLIIPEVWLQQKMFCIFPIPTHLSKCPVVIAKMGTIFAHENIRGSDSTYPRLLHWPERSSVLNGQFCVFFCFLHITGSGLTLVNRVYFNVQFYTKCAVLNPFVQFLKQKYNLKTVFSFTRFSCGCSRCQKCCHWASKI